MDNKIKEELEIIIKKLFDNGMSYDEIMDNVSAIATKEDFKRFTKKMNK